MSLQYVCITTRPSFHLIGLEYIELTFCGKQNILHPGCRRSTPLDPQIQAHLSILKYTPYRYGKGIIYTQIELFYVEQSPIPEIIKAIAEVKGTEPSELDLALYEYIEPEAIQQLASHGTASWTLSFELPEHQVAITSEGAVLVDGTERRQLKQPL